MHRVEFSAFHQVSYHPARGGGAVRGTSSEVAAPGLGSIASVDAGDAPVAFSLHAPDGVTVDVRMMDGTLMRPVRQPDSWRPCSVDDMRRFLLARPGWRDDPLCKPRRPAARIHPHRHHDRPTASSVVAGSRRFEPYDDAMRSAMGAAGTALGRLAEVGGVVMMPCPEPRLNLVELPALERGGRKRLHVTWEFDDHCRHDDPTWGRLDEEFFKSGVPAGGPPPSRQVRFPVAPREEYGNPAAAMADTLSTFAIDREDDARAFAKAMAATHGHDADGPEVVAYADPAAVSHRDEASLYPDVVLRSVLKWAQHDWGEVLNGHDSTVRDWVRARSIVSAWGTSPGEGDFRAGMDLLSDVARRIGALKRNSALSVAMHRWEAADRARDLSPGAGPEPDVSHAMASFTP